MAKSSMLALPTRTAGRASRSTTVASKGGMKPARMREPAVVSTPLVRKMSFSASGTPSRGDVASPRARRASEARAASRAGSGETRRNAPSRPSVASMRESTARVASTEESSRRERAAESSVSDCSSSGVALTR